MPPPYAQDPLAAVERGVAWRWFDLPVALVDVASEVWVVALIALALFAWLEREVRDVLKAFLPLAAALAVAGGIALLARVLGAVPRPVGGSVRGVAPLLHHAFPSGQVGSVAVFATYALLAYGWRARSALLLALALVTARVVSGGHWAADLAGGGAVGATLGALAFRLSARGRSPRPRAERGVATGDLHGPPSA